MCLKGAHIHFCGTVDREGGSWNGGWTGLDGRPGEPSLTIKLEGCDNTDESPLQYCIKTWSLTYRQVSCNSGSKSHYSKAIPSVGFHCTSTKSAISDFV